MEKKQIESIIKALIHQNLMVIDKGNKQHPDYVVGGTADLERELVNLFCQYCVSGSLQPLTVQRVDKMLKDISLETFIACGGNKAEWKQWWSKRNAVNINSNDR